jgi:tetratricopeptide (TPR) repeat protein
MQKADDTGKSLSESLLSALPSSEQLRGLQGVERDLLRRRRQSVLGLGVAFVGVLYQAVLLLASRKQYLTSVVELAHQWRNLYKTPEGISLLVIVAGIAIYLLIRYTAFLQRESEEPFRYTFWIEPFECVENKNGKTEERYKLAPDDVSRLLHHDLVERLNHRIRRLSLLDLSRNGAAGAESAGAHILIEGYYAIREDRDGEWVLQIMPRVRIGPPDRPSNLAVAVRYSLEGHKLDAQARSFLLGADGYRQVVERVYSSVATQVYRQIKSDVREKVLMFPTSYLRAVALFHEAADFEKSNTMDAYDQALDLYRESDAYFQVDLGQRLVHWSTNLGLWLPWPPWQHRRLVAEARLRLGYPRCLIYRRMVSALSGRVQNPLFEIRDDLSRARKYITQCYNRVLPGRSFRLTNPPRQAADPATEESVDAEYQALMAGLTLPDDSPLPLRRHRREIWARLRELLGEAYAVSALGYSRLNDFRRAEGFLNVARALNPTLDLSRALIDLASAEIEPSLLPKLVLLQRAVDVAPDLEIARYRLAQYLDMRARELNEINPHRVESLTRQYGEVLNINPGNIGVLISQGYLYWLVGDLDKSKRKLKAGEEQQAISSQTFVGDLKHGLARILAEQGAVTLEEARRAKDEDKKKKLRAEGTQSVFDAYQLYRQAMAANPAVATFGTDSPEIVHSYYDFVNRRMLARFRLLRSRVCRAFWELKACRGEVPRTIFRFVQSCVLNDYGNACLNYYFRCGDEKYRDHAIRCFEEAVQATDRNAAAAYNLCVAYRWRGREDDYEKAAGSISKAAKRFPFWQEAIILEAQASLQVLVQHINKKQTEVDDLVRETNKRQKEIDELLRRKKVEEDGRLQRYAASQQAVRKPAAPASPSVTTSAGVGIDVRQIAQESEETHAIEEKIKSLKEKIGQAEKGRDDLKKQLGPAAQEALQKIVGNTRLKPLVRDLDVQGKAEIDADGKGVSELLSYKGVKWESLDENDVGALRAWAQTLLNRAEDEVRAVVARADNRIQDSPALKALAACEELCQHLLKAYWPEDFDLNHCLLRALDARSSNDLDLRKACEDAIGFTVERWRKTDPSWLAQQWTRDYADIFNNQGEKLFEGRDYGAAVEMHRKAIEAYPGGAVYYYDLALALESDAKQLEVNKEIVEALEQACALDSTSREFGHKLAKVKRRNSLIEHWGREAAARSPVVDALAVEIAVDLVEFVTKRGDDGGLNDELKGQIEQIRDSIKHDLGFILPGVNFRDNQSFPPGAYFFMLREVALLGGTLDRSLRFCPRRPAEVSQYGSVASTALNPETFRLGSCPQEGAFVPESNGEKLRAAGLPLWEPMQYVVKSLGMVARLRAAEFLGAQEVLFLLGQKVPDAVGQFRKSPALLGALISVLRGLLEEGVPITDLEAILDVFNAGLEKAEGLVNTVEAVRSLPQLRAKLPGNRPFDSGTVFPLPAKIESEISDCINRKYAEHFLEAGRIAGLQHLLVRIQETLGSPLQSASALLVSQGELRPFVRVLIQSLYPTVPVLSRGEILPARVENIGEQITL